MTRSEPRRRKGARGLSGSLVSATLLCWLSLFSIAETAAAQSHPVIEAGRDDDIRALFVPYRWGRDVGAFRFETLRIRETEIRLGLSKDGLEHFAVLRHRDAAGTPTPSFAVMVEASDPEARAAFDLLIAAIARNDDGDFWRETAAIVERDEAAAEVHLPWAVDGILACALLLLWLLVLTLRSLETGEGLSRRRTLLLLGLVTVGAGLLRIGLSPETFLAAWPYTRTLHIQRAVYEGPGAHLLTAHFGLVWSKVDVSRGLGLFFGLITPLALFAHGRWLLGSARRGLFGAFIVATIPLHVRFSHSEVAFMPSIVLSSMLFASAHLALRDPRWSLRITSLLVCAPLTAAVIMARPLNVIFLPLLFGAVLWLSQDADRRMRIAVVAVVSVVGFAATVLYFWSEYGEEVHDAVDPELIKEAVLLLVDPIRNTLISPYATPTGAALLAIWAVKTQWRTERKRLIFLLVWLALFFVTHAYVVPAAPAMQARYHLHLLVPFVFLAAIGLEHLMMKDRPKWTLAAFVYLGLAPAIHYSFITDLDFNDQHEHAFLEAAAEQVEEHCTIVEYTSENFAPRWLRMAEVLDSGTTRSRWVSTPMAFEDGELTAESRSVLAEPPECLYYYEGLSCFGNKELGEPIEAGCTALRRSMNWQPVSSTDFQNRPYDGTLGTGLRSDERVTLTLYRASQ